LLKENIIESIYIVFSICEMQGYRFRESIVPVLCEFLKLPYVFSPPDSLMISLDKNLCNLLLKQNRIPIPESYCFAAVNEIENFSLENYPYFVKPSCEGSGIGIDEKSIVNSETELGRRIQFLIDKYRQPALVQKYLPNEDITIGVLEKAGQIIPLTPLSGKTGKKLTPITENSNLFNQVTEIAKKSFKTIKCRDVARIDLRLSETNEVYFLEINPLPLLTKNKGYFMESANLSGYSYDDVMETIVENTERRFNLM
jgi:D-alanine-D-alanine ligase-like ATP-grasp enzyme